MRVQKRIIEKYPHEFTKKNNENKVEQQLQALNISRVLTLIFPMLGTDCMKITSEFLL